MVGDDFEKAAGDTAKLRANSAVLANILSQSFEKVDTKQALAVIDMGIDPDMRLQDDCTLLVYACNAMNAQVVTKLLELGADPNIANTRKEVPLHYAAKGFVPEVVTALLKHGADIYARDEFNETAVEKAEGNRGTDMGAGVGMGKTAATGRFKVLTLLREGVQTRIKRDMDAALLREEIQNFTTGGCATRAEVKPMKRLQIKPQGTDT